MLFPSMGAQQLLQAKSKRQGISLRITFVHILILLFLRFSGGVALWTFSCDIMSQLVVRATEPIIRDISCNHVC